MEVVKICRTCRAACGRSGKDVCNDNCRACAVGGVAAAIFHQKDACAVGADEMKHQVGDARMIHADAHIDRHDGLGVGHEDV